MNVNEFLWAKTGNETRSLDVSDGWMKEKEMSLKRAEEKKRTPVGHPKFWGKGFVIVVHVVVEG